MEGTTVTALLDWLLKCILLLKCFLGVCFFKLGDG